MKYKDNGNPWSSNGNPSPFVETFQPQSLLYILYSTFYYQHAFSRLRDSVNRSTKLSSWKSIVPEKNASFSLPSSALRRCVAFEQTKRARLTLSPPPRKESIDWVFEREYLHAQRANAVHCLFSPLKLLKCASTRRPLNKSCGIWYTSFFNFLALMKPI